MSVPATSGNFKTDQSNMEIGDYIAFKYTATSGVAGTFSDFGTAFATAQANEIPVTGSATPNGYAYALKVAPGLLIADRVIQHSITWDALNGAMFIQGNGVSAKVQRNLSIQTGLANYAGDPSLLLDDNLATHWQPASGNASFDVLLDSPADVDSFELYASHTNEVHVKYSTDGVNFSNYGDSVKQLVTSPIWFNIRSSKKDVKAFRCNFISQGYYPPLFSVKLGINPLLVRSLTGGVAYLGSDGNKSLNEANLGAWPSNEWDKYIVNNNLNGKITSGNDSVWHWLNMFSWTQDTTINNLTTPPGNGTVGNSGAKIIRGYNTALDTDANGSGTSNTVMGFRPCFEFLEKNAKAHTLWY